MRFGKMQERRFGTDNGAYSVVTDREHYDSQITLTDYEAELVISHFGRVNLLVGPVGSNRALASKILRRYPSGETIKLNINYPKPEKTEMRLYLADRSGTGFKPEGGEIWFMFVRDGDLWIGAMSEASWRSELSELKKDDFDSIYQESLDETDSIRVAKLKERDTYARDRRIAIKRMKMSSFSCEYDPEHNLFISRFSRKPYLEAHHLIPIGLQGDFTDPLDTVHNVFCLCAYCHRAVHHAEEFIARDILSKLASTRPVLDMFTLRIADLFSLYAVEEID
jgi:5-methylcytosine-specific restriction enzyme A